MNSCTRIHRLLRLTFALLGAVALTVGLSSPAQADRSDCPTNRFCVWEEAGYSGRMQIIGATNSYESINIQTVRAYYNRRTDRTWLHENRYGGANRLCINPGASSTNVTISWQRAAEAAYLSTATNC